MRLTRRQNEMLDGKLGYPVQKAMEILVGLGECFDSKRLIPVSSVHLAANNAFGAGDFGIAFIKELADKGGKFRVFTDTNPVTTPYGLWREIGISEEWAHKQEILTRGLARMGGFTSNTCTPYLVGNIPRQGEHIAWSEPAATVFANSVLGAMTNRESGPSAIASALTGLTPEYGMHFCGNRYGEVEIAVTARIRELWHYGALGYFAGCAAQDQVPVFTGMKPLVSWNELKLLCATYAISGSAAMVHAAGITPEAPTIKAAFSPERLTHRQTIEFGEKELADTHQVLASATSSSFDLVILGCPHYSISEIAGVARLLYGKKLRFPIWIQTSQIIKGYAEKMGYLRDIEAAGGRILGEACQDMMPPGFFTQQGYRTVATDSVKLAFYIKALHNVVSHIGTADQCIKAAIAGTWEF